MIQLTSNLDYKLTKKRLMMMGRKLSPFRSNVRRMFLIPLLGAVTFYFCTEERRPDYEITSDIDLTYEQIYDNFPAYFSLNFLAYGPDGAPYTGEQNWYFANSNALHRRQVYENGRETLAVFFSEDADTVLILETNYLNPDSGIAEIKHFRTTPDKGRFLYWKNSFSDSLTTVYEYYNNGQLKSQYSYETDQGAFHGLVTAYDEEGNITEQELWEDGELVEKIK